MLEFIKKHSVELLAGAGVASLVTALIFAAKEIPECVEELEGEDDPIEEIKIVAKECKGTIAFGIIAVTSVLKLAVSAKNTKNIAQATLFSYDSLQRYIHKYRQEVVNRYGKEVDKDIEESLCHSCDFHIQGLTTPDRLITWKDEISGLTFKKYEREVIDAEYHFNRNFMLRGWSELREWYYFLCTEEEMKQVERVLGDKLDTTGWSHSDDYFWLDAIHRLNKDNTVSIIPIFDPTSEALDGWV